MLRKIAELIVKFIPAKYRATLAYILLQYFDFKIIAPYLKDKSIITTPDSTFIPLLRTRNYHEKSDVDFVKRFINPDMVVLDIGSNVGYYSLFFADIIQSGGGHVYCFEPTADTFKQLQDNIYINRFTDKTITLHKVALYKENTEMEFQIYDPKLYSGLNTLGNRDIILNGKRLIPEIQKVECITLDSFAKGKNLKKVDFIKVDVEGSELHVLQGGEKLLRNSAQNYLFVIMTEISDNTLHDAGTSSKELFMYIENLGLQIGTYDAESNKVHHHQKKEFYDNINLLFCKSINAVNIQLQNTKLNL